MATTSVEATGNGVKSSAGDAASSPTSPVLDDISLSLEGITMVLNNDYQKAQELFDKYKPYSPLMSFGSSFVAFLHAMMTFEDEKLAIAMQSLQETEQKCENRDGFIRRIKNKIIGGKSEIDLLPLAERLQRQVIIADCLLYQAVLTFINQDITSFVKGGWLMRKAWKIYEKTYKEIKDLYDDKLNSQVGLGESAAHSSLTSDDESFPSSSAPESLSLVNSVSSLASSNGTDAGELNEATLSRLLGAVSFGHGTFQLIISLVPPKILKIIEFLGFDGDRMLGLQGLEVSSQSKDMKAPLASLALLWYHTVIRPFFALDGMKMDAGVEGAQEVMERCEKEYPNSALFLFFKGRILRLQSKVQESLSTYHTALVSCQSHREIQLICIHEIGWGQLMRLKWEDGMANFLRLKEESRWSKSFYTYLVAVCQGSLGDVKGGWEAFKQVPKLVRKKNNQIETFVSRRADRSRREKPNLELAQLLALEILYLWNALPQCEEKDIKKMLEILNNQTDKKVFHLRSLIEGAIFRLQGDEELAMQCYREAIARHQGMKEDHHVAAFAMFDLGCILCQNPKTLEEGRQYILKVRDGFKDFDFDNRLNVRVHAALRRIKRDGSLDFAEATTPSP